MIPLCSVSGLVSCKQKQLIIIRTYKLQTSSSLEVRENCSAHLIFSVDPFHFSLPRPVRSMTPKNGELEQIQGLTN